MDLFLYYKKAEGLRDSTITDYRKKISQFFNSYEPKNETEMKLKLFEFLSSNRNNATYNLRLTYLKSFLDWCVEEKFLSSNPLKKFRKKKATCRVVELSDRQVAELLRLPDLSTFAGIRDYALIFLTLDTGIRPSEALQLRERDFDFKNLTCFIGEEIAKNKTARILNITAYTASLIRKVIAAKHELWNQELVFCNCDGKTFSPAAWGDRLERYSKKLDFKVTPYMLRHYFAISFLRNKGDIFTLQKILGHSTLEMTKIYLHITGQDIKNSHALCSPVNKFVKHRIRKLK